MEEKTTTIELTRGRFLSLGVALGAGTALATACGGGTTSGGSGDSGDSGGSSGESSSDSSGGSSDSSGSSETTQASGGDGSAPAADAIASEADVPAGESVEFEDSGDPAVLVHLDGGDFVAYSAVCTHAGCTVAYRDAQLVCPCHGSVFDPADGGAVVNGPATSPLPEIPVEVQGGEIVRA